MKSTRTMLIAALAAGALLACSSTLLAQDATTNTPAANPPAGGMRGRGGPTLAQLTTALNLTDDQKPKVQAVLDDQKKQMTDLRNDPDFSSMSQADRRTKMQAIRADITAKMKAILTDDQFAKYQKMGGRNRGGAGGGNPPPAAAPQN
jgi:Spy/CpxP family protein refolding chaperone